MKNRKASWINGIGIKVTASYVWHEDWQEYAFCTQDGFYLDAKVVQANDTFRWID